MYIAIDGLFRWCACLWNRVVAWIRLTIRNYLSTYIAFSATPSSDRYTVHVSADMTDCPWKLNHGDHHVSCFYHYHTHTRFPRCRSNPRHDVPRRGHGSSDVAITALPCLSFADRWDARLWVPHVSERMVGLFASGDPHPPDVPLFPLGPTAPLPLCA